MAGRELADALFRPRAVALVGASGDAAKNTARPQRFLKKHGFAGRVIPINPGRDEVLGARAWPDLVSAPGPIDHAFIMVPAAAVPAVIDDCVAAGVTVATIFSDGFAEAGAEGVRRQSEILATARKGGLRLVGPNSMGVIDVHGSAPITVNAVLEMPQIVPGPLGVISHSGTIVGTLISRGQARGMGFSKLVAIGNEADLSVGEIGEMMVDDAATGAILLFLETIRDPAGLAAMARRAFDAGKPVIAYKLGRSDAGRRLVVSHSGAIAGDDQAAAAFFRHHGIIRVDMMETILEIPALVTGRRPKPGRRVAVLTTTGGGAAMVVDRLGALDIDLITPPDGLRELLEPAGVRLGGGPVIDVTMAGTRREVYQPALEALMAAPECDAVVAVVGSSAQFHPGMAVEPIVAAAASGDKPVAVFLVPEATESLALLAEAGIAAFRTPEACADGIRACLGWSPPAPPAPAPQGDGLGLAAAALSAAQGPVLDELAARAVFEALGIDQAPAHVLGDGGPGSRVGYPVAAKVLSPAIAHKTEAGGVVLGIADDGALAAAAEDIRARVAKAYPDAGDAAILVQRMEHGLAEVLIGYRHTAEAGPVVMVAPGGTLAEIYRDAALRIAPVDAATALEMIEEVKGLAPLRGYRGLAKGDLAALAAAIAALSDLARLAAGAARVIEAEINPLIVRAEGAGVVAVDGLVVLDGAPGAA